MKNAPLTTPNIAKRDLIFLVGKYAAYDQSNHR